ncbi:MAG TPA: alpha/beta fold hydrolase [Vicinamibacterales bacterium]|nr:alpha/beta fold hydrolase [Vicinamibacterales bacterium]
MMQLLHKHRRRMHCTVALLLLSTVRPVSAQDPPAPVPGDASFTVFVRGTDVGRELVKLSRSGSIWIISSTGRTGDLTINRFELKYAADWQPVELRIEATQAQNAFQLATSFNLTTAISEITRNGVTNTKTDEMSARSVVLPNNFYAAYEALAPRLSVARPGAEIPIYVAPQAEVKLTVKSVTAEAVETLSGKVDTRRYDVEIHNPGGVLAATVTIDGRHRFARLDIPAAALSVVRNDLASVAVRSHGARNPSDSDVVIPGNGFNLAGTLTMPPSPGRLRHPTVVLVAGSGSVDRDKNVAGIPIFSQLAGALAGQGFLVLRYDRRGVGQSGGRTETATLQDYSDDVVAIVRWLRRRDDVDRERLTVMGHSEGGIVAMLAAARERRIQSLVLIATPGTTGAELILEQQQRQLASMKLPEAEQQEKIALQKKIQQAVATGRGWEDVPPELRRQADTPWFRSLLLFDPARTMARLRQPILIVQGDLDTQVLPHHAEKLASYAQARRNDAPVEVVHLSGVNHLMVRAATGEVQEYAELTERQISDEATKAITEWLKERR